MSVGTAQAVMCACFRAAGRPYLPMPLLVSRELMRSRCTWGRSRCIWGRSRIMRAWLQFSTKGLSFQYTQPAQKVQDLSEIMCWSRSILKNRQTYARLQHPAHEIRKPTQSLKCHAFHPNRAQYCYLQSFGNPCKRHRDRNKARSWTQVAPNSLAKVGGTTLDPTAASSPAASSPRPNVLKLTEMNLWPHLR